MPYAQHTPLHRRQCIRCRDVACQRGPQAGNPPKICRRELCSSPANLFAGFAGAKLQKCLALVGGLSASAFNLLTFESQKKLFLLLCPSSKAKAVSMYPLVERFSGIVIEQLRLSVLHRSSRSCANSCLGIHLFRRCYGHLGKCWLWSPCSAAFWRQVSSSSTEFYSSLSSALLLRMLLKPSIVAVWLIAAFIAPAARRRSSSRDCPTLPASRLLSSLLKADFLSAQLDGGKGRGSILMLSRN